MATEQFIDIPEGAVLYPLRDDGRAEMRRPMVMEDGEQNVPVSEEDSVCYEVKVLGEYYVYFKPARQGIVDAVAARLCS